VQLPRDGEQTRVRPPRAPQLQFTQRAPQIARWEVVEERRARTTQAPLPELTPNSTYRWSVRARDRTGRTSEASTPLYLRCEYIIH